MTSATDISFSIHQNGDLPLTLVDCLLKEKSEIAGDIFFFLVNRNILERKTKEPGQTRTHHFPTGQCTQSLPNHQGGN